MPCDGVAAGTQCTETSRLRALTTLLTSFRACAHIHLVLGSLGAGRQLPGGTLGSAALCPSLNSLLAGSAAYVYGEPAVVCGQQEGTFDGSIRASCGRVPGPSESVKRAMADPVDLRSSQDGRRGSRPESSSPAAKRRRGGRRPASTIPCQASYRPRAPAASTPRNPAVAAWTCRIAWMRELLA